ncbi:cytochrome P450 [Periconia macrospinosa]|uniref:Cytochrome P450 n=1 Tax=Periconia macrospinosa TaxID=97972 RepID=A0A2V1DIK2_9PLEO|nr:cytochrome P450 [Periconia macrospinosa]
MSMFEVFFVLLKVLVALFAFRCVWVYSYRLLLHPLHSYPGPFIAKFTDWYGAYHAIRMRLHIATYNDHLKYGTVFRQGPNKLVFGSVLALHDILENSRLSKTKAYGATQPTPEVFNLLNVLDKQLHRTKRRIIGQGLNERAMRRFEPVMHEQVRIFLQQLAKASQNKEVTDMSQKCGWLGLDISGEIGFGHGFDLQTKETNRWMPIGIWTSSRRLNVYLQFPGIRYIGWEKLFMPIIFPKVRRFHRLLRDMIRVRLEEDLHSRPDIFSSIHDYKDPDTGKSMGKEELWSESAFLLPAGGDTTASLLAASFFYLSRYPKTYERLANEIRETFSSAEEINNGPTLAGCSFLRAFIQETLRISPSANMTLWRDLPADAAVNPVVIDGHVIPPGTTIGVNIYSYFPEPNIHKPTRWIREESNATEDEWKTQNEAFTPFSLGSRNCAGKAVVYAEVPLVLAKTLWHFDFDKVDGENEGENPTFQMYDQITSRHAGPLLRFRLRSNTGLDPVQ